MAASGPAAGFRWESTTQRSWSSLVENSAGQLVDSSGSALLRKRRRSEAPGAVRRGMIRYLYVIVDRSRSMSERDPVLRPTRAAATSSLLTEFIHAFFTQNPISNVGLIVTRDGVAEKLTDLSGSPRAHVEALRENLSTSGDASLQNPLEMALTLLQNIPEYGNREVLICYGSLSTTDPGDIFATIAKLKRARIRVSVIGLTAEMQIIKTIVHETGGSLGVVCNVDHFKQLLEGHLVPPPTSGKRASMRAEFVQMGFPKRLQSSAAVLGYERGKMQYLQSGFECPRCLTRASEVPSSCAVCTLQLVSSPHLAQSYHHLFPLPRFTEIPAEEHQAGWCSGCDIELPAAAVAEAGAGGAAGPAGAAAADEALRARYQCPDCKNFFCIHCDIFAHESLHNCPACT